MFVALVTPFEVAFVEETNNIDGLFITNRLVDLIFLIVRAVVLLYGLVIV